MSEESVTRGILELSLALLGRLQLTHREMMASEESSPHSIVLQRKRELSMDT